MEFARTGEVTIRPFAANDEGRVLDMLRLVFRARHGIDLVARDIALWRWQHLQNPAGTQMQLAMIDSGKVASLYAAIPQLADTTDGPRQFVHVLHTLTHPDHREPHSQRELIQQLGHAFSSNRANHNELGYGMPLADAERTCRQLLGYRMLHPIEYWLRAPSAPLPKASADVHIKHVDMWPPSLDSLWHESLPMQPCTVRKDHRYLHWRYVQHPDRDSYIRITAYREAQLTGVMVLRPNHELIPGACTITDLICRDEDDGTAMSLLREAARLAAHRDRTLLAVFADHDPNAARLAVAGARRVPSANWDERCLNFRIMGNHIDPDMLATRWRYALGDTDLV